MTVTSSFMRLLSYNRYWTLNYARVLLILKPVNRFLSLVMRSVRYRNSVLHISYMVHVPYYMTRVLRRHGVRADYLATGTSPYWDKCDHLFAWANESPAHAWREFVFFWKTVSRYEAIHLHFAYTMSISGWELPVLKALGRRIIVHFRGCEGRDRDTNLRLHPDCNICTDCDYNAETCCSPKTLKRRTDAMKYADVILVTTPDMLDFIPNAVQFPFFAPENLPESACPTTSSESRAVRLVHATCHPGIEGSERIRHTVDRLRNQRYALEFVFLTNLTHDQVLSELARADISIGKMKMGYYANAQIEAMCLGVPTITYVRSDFMTDELMNSGFIFCTLETLEETLKFYLDHPDELDKKRRIARESILRLHDNDVLAQRLISIYRGE